MGEQDARALVAHPRDRSFYGSRPNGQPTKVHRESPSESGMAACDTRSILLNTDLQFDVADLQQRSPTLLCRRCFTPGQCKAEQP